MTAVDVTNMYWEGYDDQDSKDFDFVGYVDLSGNEVVVEVSDNLAAQVAEIKRCNGHKTQVRVYKNKAS